MSSAKRHDTRTPTIDETALRHAFADQAEAMLQRSDMGHVLYRLTDQVVDVLEVDDAGISLREEADQLRFVTATDERASRVENAQIAARDPAYEAFRSGAIVAVDDLEARSDIASQLQQALDSRVVIEQAKGVLVERHGIDPDAASAQLRKHARSNSLRLHDVADQVVSRQPQL